jgi:hypothetical protein
MIVASHSLANTVMIEQPR